MPRHAEKVMDYPNKHIRLKNYDYSSPGFYFVTICTKDRMEYFGKVEDGIVNLNEFGNIAQNLWQSIPIKYPSVKLDIFIIMPNHLHGIIIIEPRNDIIQKNDGTPRRAATPLISLMPNSLSSIINHYKGAVKKECTKKGFGDFKWQSRFYDHVIRKDESLDKIRQYIRNNPLKWELDRNNPESLWM